MPDGFSRLPLFERVLAVRFQEVELLLRAYPETTDANFILNPRRLRGSDFLMRWSQGVWSEERLLESVNGQGDFYAIAYGPSSTAPSGDVKAFEIYFEKLEAAGLGSLKRPDLLVFKGSDRAEVSAEVQRLGGESELPFIPEERLEGLLRRAVVAVECENSLWVAGKMPDFGSELRPMKRLDGKLGLRKSAVLPTVIIKEEDREPLAAWQRLRGVPIHIWHVFFDRAYGLAFDEAQRLIAEGLIDPTVQTFQAPGGATTRKAIYKIYYHYAYPLGIASEEPALVPDYVEDKNGHILPYVRFQGGALRMLPEALEVLGAVAHA